MRPLLKRVLAPENKPLALPVSAEVGMPAMAVAAMPGAVAGPAALGQEMVAADQGAPPPTLPGWMKDARNLGAAQAQTLKTVGTLVEENPKQAALIVRDWLSSAV